MSDQGPAREKRNALLAYANAKLDTAALTDDPNAALDLAEAAFAFVAVLDIWEGVAV